VAVMNRVTGTHLRDFGGIRRVARANVAALLARIEREAGRLTWRSTMPASRVGPAGSRTSAVVSTRPLCEVSAPA